MTPLLRKLNWILPLMIPEVSFQAENDRRSRVAGIGPSFLLVCCFILVKKTSIAKVTTTLPPSFGNVSH